jgi:ATP-dependent DNA helicase RecQ
MAPDPSGVMRKIPEEVRVEPGVALARIGDGGWWPAIERGLADGRLEDEAIAGLVAAVRQAAVAPAWLTLVPSRAVQPWLEDVAARLAGELGIPYLAGLVARVDDRPPQREMANAAQQAANVRGAFGLTGTPPSHGVGLLLDDRRGSGWTLAMVGGQLRRAGAEAVVPLALATAG